MMFYFQKQITATGYHRCSYLINDVTLTVNTYAFYIDSYLSVGSKDESFRHLEFCKSSQILAES